MKEIFIKTQKTARVFSKNSENKKAKDVVIALHGYAQLASFFLKKFDFLEESKTPVYAPEGLSRFYWNGMSGRVVASWMTKEDRKNEIIDQEFFLNSLLKQVQQNHPNAEITILGFSQGSATASRWINSSKFCPKRFIIWAGDIPEDVLSSQHLKSFPIQLVLGDSDQFIPLELASKQIELYKEEKFQLEVIRYQGDHKIYPEVLSNLFR